LYSVAWHSLINYLYLALYSNGVFSFKIQDSKAFFNNSSLIYLTFSEAVILNDLPLASFTTNDSLIIANTTSIFGSPVFIERCEVNNLRKPYKKDAVLAMISESLVVKLANGKSLRMTASEKVKYIKDELLKNALESWILKEKTPLEYKAKYR
jgi:hypothetical protein